MSATVDPSGTPDEYFHTIEETFIRLRGAPLLLSPADWQTARLWHEEGIPLQLVDRVMEEVFLRLRERDPKRKIHSLRYCAPAVESAWREVRDLGATEGRLEPLPIDVVGRLEALAAGLPRALERRDALARDLLALAGEAEAVEADLQEIEERFIVTAIAGLDAEVHQQLLARVAGALARARARVAAEELPELERRLLREFARQHLGLPTLSLFPVAD